MAQVTPKQAAFCREYVKDFNGAQAAIRAGYAKVSAATQATDILTRPHIKEFIRKLTDKAADDAGVTTEYVVAGIKRTTELALLAGQYSAAQRGWELLGKTKAMFIERVENVTQMSDDELARVFDTAPEHVRDWAAAKLGLTRPSKRADGETIQ